MATCNYVDTEDLILGGQVLFEYGYRPIHKSKNTIYDAMKGRYYNPGTGWFQSINPAGELPFAPVPKRDVIVTTGGSHRPKIRTAMMPISSEDQMLFYFFESVFNGNEEEWEMKAIFQICWGDSFVSERYNYFIVGEKCLKKVSMDEMFDSFMSDYKLSAHMSIEGKVDISRFDPVIVDRLGKLLIPAVYGIPYGLISSTEHKNIFYEALTEGELNNEYGHIIKSMVWLMSLNDDLSFIESIKTIRAFGNEDILDEIIYCRGSSTRYGGASEYCLEDFKDIHPEVRAVIGMNDVRYKVTAFDIANMNAISKKVDQADLEWLVSEIADEFIHGTSSVSKIKMIIESARLAAEQGRDIKKIYEMSH